MLVPGQLPNAASNLPLLIWEGCLGVLLFGLGILIDSFSLEISLLTPLIITCLINI